jgi:hypothetical protein
MACVHYNASAVDKLAPGGALPQAMVAFYCRYPLRAGFGLALVYSQRAHTIDADLAQQAHAFFDGVRVRASDEKEGSAAGSKPTNASERAEAGEASREDAEREE